MANLKTIGRTREIWGIVNEVLWPFRLDAGAVVFDTEGIVENPGGTLGDLRQKNGPGVLELTYRELSSTMLKKFARYTPDPIPEPTEKEWIAFQRKLLGTASRIIYREFKKRRGNLPRTASRERSKAARAKLIEASLTKYRELGMTAAVKKTANDLGMSIPTVWRYARELGMTENSRR